MELANLTHFTCIHYGLHRLAYKLMSIQVLVHMSEIIQHLADYCEDNVMNGWLSRIHSHSVFAKVYAFFFVGL